MRIAIVTTSYPAFEGDPSGHFVQADARELERQGHAVAVLAPPSGTADDAFGWPGVAARVRERPLRVIPAMGWIARASVELSRLAPERVVAHWALPCAWPIALSPRASWGRTARAADGPRPSLEIVSHGGDVRLLLATPAPVRSRLVRALARRADTWRFVSATLRDALLEPLDAPARAAAQAIAIVRAPLLDLPDVDAAVRARRVELGATRVAVSVGRLIASKRVDRAIDFVARSADFDALVIVGDGPERAELERHARARKVDARFAGTLDRRDALTWIGAADALVFASEAEGLSTVVREAEALSTPVIRLD